MYTWYLVLFFLSGEEQREGFLTFYVQYSTLYMQHDRLGCNLALIDDLSQKKGYVRRGLGVPGFPPPWELDGPQKREGQAGQ